MITLFTREEMLNKCIKPLSDQYLLDGSFTAEYVDPKYKPMFAFDCGNVYCIGKLIPKLSYLYPGMSIKMRATSVAAVLAIQPNTMIVRMSGRLDLLATRLNSTDKLICSGNINLEVPLQVRFQGMNISVRASNIWGNLTIDSSNIGNILDSDAQNILNNFILRGKSTITDQLNKYETSIPIKPPIDIAFIGASLKLQPGILSLEAEICYKEACSYSGSGMWKGESFITTGRTISVFDVTPLDTTNKPADDGKVSGECGIKALSLPIAFHSMMIILSSYI